MTNQHQLTPGPITNSRVLEHQFTDLDLALCTITLDPNDTHQLHQIAFEFWDLSPNDSRRAIKMLELKTLANKYAPLHHYVGESLYGEGLGVWHV